jgi:hypothetical protein
MAASSTRGVVVVILAAAAFAGCKKREEPTPREGSGSAHAGAMRPSQTPQPKLPPPPDAGDPKKVELGHVLFFDKRLSGANDRACYSCHQNEDGNGGHDPIAIGSGDKPLTRHSPVIWNVGYWNNAFYWDGRAKTLEDNAKGAWSGGNMGGAMAGAKPEETTLPSTSARPTSPRSPATSRCSRPRIPASRTSRPSTSRARSRRTCAR